MKEGRIALDVVVIANDQATEVGQERFQFGPLSIGQECFLHPQFFTNFCK
jgi:hypothetical protein